MFRPIIVLAACAAALSGTAQAQDVSTNFKACFSFCANNGGPDAQNAPISCNPVTVVDAAKCFCDEKAIFSDLQSCMALACPVFKDQLTEGCDKLRDVKSSGAGEPSHGGMSRLVASCAVVVGTLLL